MLPERVRPTPQQLFDDVQTTPTMSLIGSPLAESTIDHAPAADDDVDLAAKPKPARQTAAQHNALAVKYRRMSTFHS
jgi:hypothetical protein